MGSWSKGKRRATLTLEPKLDDIAEMVQADGIEINEVLGDCQIEISLILHGRTYYDPGCWYLPNGDPGNPPEYDEEFPLYEEDVNVFKEIFGKFFDVRLSVDDEVY